MTACTHADREPTKEPLHERAAARYTVRAVGGSTYLVERWKCRACGVFLESATTIRKGASVAHMGAR